MPQSMRACCNCRVRFLPRRFDQEYCSTACNDEAGKRELRRARRVYRVLMRIFGKRKYEGRGADFTFLYREVRSWIEEDRDAQRLPPPKHDHTADRGHQREARPVSVSSRKVA